ncbi:hypothetical protein KI614_08255 [Dechloromonas denitrificans]|uniref:hypothetical protein n=1 Tax=Dechloromonas denitrificans TaxID=281362 RepID=UPI001CF90A45|nr:hypothetical protein [Dechloromonas denitrificans]UCV10217.1 hypothetical protein KI614_08255 [Dechloromonas denitrificans]
MRPDAAAQKNAGTLPAWYEAKTGSADFVIHIFAHIENHERGKTYDEGCKTSAYPGKFIHLIPSVGWLIFEF